MKDFTLGLLLLVLGIGVLLTAQDYPAIGDLRYGAGLFPSLIGTGLLAGGLCLAIGAARRANCCAKPRNMATRTCSPCPGPAPWRPWFHAGW